MKLLSANILKQSIRNNWKLWTMITGTLCLLVVMATLVSNTVETGGFPGPGGMEFGLLNIYANMIFGMMGLLMVLIYAIIVGNKLVASEVDSGTMSFTLNTPITRRQIILSKALFYVTSIVLMTVLVGLSGTAACAAMGADVDIVTFWTMILGFTLFALATSGICIAASCWFNKGGESLMIGAGLPIAFFLFRSMSDMNSLEFLKYLSLNTLFDTTAIIAGDGYVIQFIVLGLIAIALYAIGINKFLRKDLPL